MPAHVLIVTSRYLLVVTEGGHAKRVELAAVPVTGRGRSGVRSARADVEPVRDH